MKILQTSGTLNERIGQYINTALKEESDRERERGSQRKWGETGVEEKRRGGGGGERECANLEIQL